MNLTREAVLRVLTEHHAEMERMGAVSLALFGSVARGDAGPGSDADLLVELTPDVGLLAFARLQERLEQILGARVDLVTRGALKPRLGDRILTEAIRAA